MAIALIVNSLLLAFSVFTFFYVGATMPKSDANVLGAEQWPQMLLFLLILAICYNIYKYFRENKREDIAASFKDLGPGTARFFKSKLFIGMVLLIVMALAYEPVGFITTSILFLISYGILLGERKPLRLVLSALVITLILYIGFAVMLGVLLPRGNIGFLRAIALFLESIVQALGL
jgi:hypothetical protein